MECSCTCDLDYEQPEFIRYTIVKARKEHTCCECDETIPVGREYEYVSGRWGGDFWTFKTCTTCAAIRENYCCSFGGMRNDLWEVLGLDYITGETMDDDD